MYIVAPKRSTHSGCTLNACYSVRQPALFPRKAKSTSYPASVDHGREKEKQQPTSLVLELPPPIPLHRLQPHAIDLDPLRLIRLPPILLLFLRARHSRPPETGRRGRTLKCLTMPPMLVRELLRASLEDDILLLRYGILSRKNIGGNSEHFLEQLFVGLVGAWQEVISRGFEDAAAAGCVNAAGEAVSVGFGESVHWLHIGKVAVGVVWVDAEVLGLEVLFLFGAEGF
jgi:hypothetical protein